MFPSQEPQTEKPRPRPSQTTTIPYVRYVTQASAPPPSVLGSHTRSAHPAQTSSSASEDQGLGGKAFIRRGLLLGFGMSGKIWKINLTISSPVNEWRKQDARVLMHMMPRFCGSVLSVEDSSCDY